MLFADGAGLGSAESPGGTRLSLASFALFPLDDFQILFFFFAFLLSSVCFRFNCCCRLLLEAFFLPLSQFLRGVELLR